MIIKKLKNVLFFLLGTIFLGFGIAGIVLPVLPGGPFLMIAAFCYAKSSKRIDDWFKSTTFYTKYVLAIKEKKGMTLKEKIRINLIADAFILFSVFYIDIWLVKIVLIVLGLIKHYYFIKKIKTIKPEEVSGGIKNRA
ncbi:YbaN family protein [Terribacillus sp. JSM ZJ617]|uniref:YbaN family protein n=1 Tax=Terribacillus sp. JSM ZJ617 TaxID=3342119 RepID=UPI0035A8A540